MTITLTSSVRSTIIESLYAHRLEWSEFVRVSPAGVLEAFENNPVSQRALQECLAIDHALQVLGVKV